MAKSEERCRELTIENSKLGANLERSEGMLEQARRRGAEATAMVGELRAAGIEIERLKQELGAVRADCGTLVQLVRQVLFKCWRFCPFFFLYVYHQQLAEVSLLQWCSKDRHHAFIYTLSRALRAYERVKFGALGGIRFGKQVASARSDAGETNGINNVYERQKCFDQTNSFRDYRKGEDGRRHITCFPCVLTCLTRAARKSSTKEYSYFRRLWDDSGGLTRINNAFHGDSGGSRVGRSTRGTFGGNGISGARETDCESSVDDLLVPQKVGTIESSARLSRKSTMRTPEEPNVTLPPPPPPPSLLPPKKQKLRCDQQASATGTIHSKCVEASKEETAKAAAAAVWDEAMRSEWSSPSEKIIIEAVLTAKAEAAASADESNKTVPRTVDRRGHKANISTSAASVSFGGEEQITTQGQWVKRGKLDGDSSGRGRVGRAISTASSISCGEEVVEGVRSDSRLVPVTVPASGVLVTSPVVDRTTATTTTSSSTSEIPPPMEKPGLGDKTTESPGNNFRCNDGGYGDSDGGRGKSDGGCGGGLQSGARKAVQWGRLDLFSVLYPPPRPTGSGECLYPRASIYVCLFIILYIIR